MHRSATGLCQTATLRAFVQVLLHDKTTGVNKKTPGPLRFRHEEERQGSGAAGKPQTKSTPPTNTNASNFLKEMTQRTTEVAVQSRAVPCSRREGSCSLRAGAVQSGM